MSGGGPQHADRAGGVLDEAEGAHALFARAEEDFSAAGGALGGARLHVGDDDPSNWPSRPVVLPETWDAVEVEQLWVHGRPARLLATHGADRARIDLEASSES